MKVMLLESNRIWARWWNQVLAEESMELIEVVGKGTGWMSNYQQQKPELLIIDYFLPGRDGLFCLNKAREFNLPTFFLFTHAFQGRLSNEVAQKAFAQGAVGVLQKPIRRNQLKAVLAHIRKEALKGPVAHKVLSEN